MVRVPRVPPSPAALRRMKTSAPIPITSSASLAAASSSDDLSEHFLARHPCQPIPLRGGVDRYGFSHLLAQRLGLARPPRSFANWLHGWIWWEAQDALDLMFNHAIRHKTHVVADPSQRAVLLKEGFTDVRAGGLPFAYTTKSAYERIPGSLLVMPPHSSEVDKLKNSQTAYLDYVESIKASFELVVVCVFHSDLTPEFEADLRRRGLHYLLGARPDDANALQRMRAIFEAFEFVTTNTMGSHIAYAMLCGCRTSIAGPAYAYKQEDFESLNNPENAAYLKRLLHYYSRDYLAREYPGLITNSPAEGVSNVDLGRRAVGAAHLLDDREIIDALSWRTWSQIIGYLDAGRLRMRKAVRPSQRRGLCP